MVARWRPTSKALYLDCFTMSEHQLEPITTYYTGTVQNPRQLGNLNLPMKHKPLTPHLIECFDGNGMKLLIRGEPLLIIKFPTHVTF